MKQIVNQHAWYLLTAALLIAGGPSVVTLHAQNFTNLYDFDFYPHGATPVAPLFQGTDGNLYGTAPAGGAYGSGGSIFRITLDGTLTTVFSFCAQGNPCGPQPTSGFYGPTTVIQAADGNMYGIATEVSGESNGGIFEFTRSGAFSTLYTFCSQGGSACTDGSVPIGIIQAADGKFYGTTATGGIAGIIDGGTVFKLTPGGALTTLYRFCSKNACADGSLPGAGVIQGASGNFYGTTRLGGAYNGGTVFGITPDGALTTLYSFCSQGGTSCTDGQEPFAALIQATDGAFYGTTYSGGTNGAGTFFRITPDGNLTTLYSFCAESGCRDGERPNGLIQATNSNFYGTTYGARSGSDFGTVFEITPNGKLTTLYRFCSEIKCADGNAPAAALVQATNGDLYGTTEFGGAKTCCEAITGGTVFRLSLP
jgi:uncharacterized repeat protein (TIGR03803 family)